MPTYEYKCAKGHKFEKLQRFSEAPIKKCPKCGGKTEKQMSGGAGLIFKGSGFYETDYKRKAVQSDSTSGKPSPSDADKPAPTKLSSGKPPKASDK